MKITNRRAFHNYHFIQTLEAGVKLRGMEVKAIRAGRIDLSESFARVLGHEAYLINAHIPPYLNSPAKDYNPTRQRKLLLHRNQLKMLETTLTGGTVLVPLSVYTKNNFIKVELGIGKSKRTVDKRRVLKEKDNIRRMEQELRGKE